MQIKSQFAWNTIDRIETHHKHLIVGTTLQNVYIVCSYCAASEVPVARLPGSSGFGKACCFFPGNMAGLEKPVFFSPLYSVQSACLQAVFLNV